MLKHTSKILHMLKHGSKRLLKNKDYKEYCLKYTRVIQSVVSIKYNTVMTIFKKF